MESLGEGAARGCFNGWLHQGREKAERCWVKMWRSHGLAVKDLQWQQVGWGQKKGCLSLTMDLDEKKKYPFTYHLRATCNEGLGIDPWNGALTSGQLSGTVPKHKCTSFPEPQCPALTLPSLSLFWNTVTSFTYNITS